MTTVQAEPKRGGCLTLFLVAMMVLNPLAGLYYLFSGSTIQQAIPSLPGWAIPVLAVLSFANLVFSIAVWRWKKWGVYGFAGTSLVAFVVNATNLGLGSALVGLIGLALLVFLLRDVWKHMS